ncbi:hypothetical protein CRI94_17300 [Longibacter salinarum]|uniref:Uncharacterized protein n=1 Tax=Longibacter salinarum TaxID=1850348 RepID=A0A2A8CTH8_9BACT|nr:hypothetical protein CRI94_17300 [Longibacter salinarum]
MWKFLRTLFATISGVVLGGILLLLLLYWGCILATEGPAEPNAAADSTAHVSYERTKTQPNADLVAF